MAGILAGARHRMKRFNRLSTIDPAAKASICTSIRRNSVRAEAYSLRETVFFSRSLPVLSLVAVITTVLEAVLLFHPDGRAFGRVLIACLGIALVESAVQAMAHRHRLPGSTFMAILLNALPIVLAGLLGLGLLLYATTEYSRFSSRTGTGQVGAALIQAALLLPTVATIAVIYVEKFIPFLIQRIRQSYYPDVMIVSELCMILIGIENDPAYWSSISGKRELLSRLEGAARCVQHGLPRMLSTGDKEMRSWLAEESKAISASIRHLKHQVVLPDSEALEQFTKHIVEDLVFAANGEWIKMRRAEPPEHLAAHMIVRDALSILRTLSISALPFACLVAIQQSSMALEGALANYFKAGAILWGLVTILRTFDPQYSAKLTTVRDLVGIVHTHPKEKDS